MAEKVTAWQASDGTLHQTEQCAKDKDFQLALDAWMEAKFKFTRGDDDLCDQDRGYLRVIDAIVEDRMKLLQIFKMLNGESGSFEAYPTRTAMGSAQAGQAVGVSRAG
jgi:hypothetical protein